MLKNLKRYFVYFEGSETPFRCLVENKKVAEANFRKVHSDKKIIEIKEV